MAVTKRGKHWTAIYYEAVTDPKTGATRRRQKWVTIRDPKVNTETKAEKWLSDLLHKREAPDYVEPTRTTLAEFMRNWLASAVLPTKRPRTCAAYSNVVARIAKAPIGSRLLQKVTPTDLEAYYTDLGAAPATVALHHSVIRKALARAVRDRVLPRNVARDGVELPAKRGQQVAEAREHCWTLLEAQRFLAKAKAERPQVAAFFALALDTGMRKGELFGLAWAQVDLDAARIEVTRQLVSVADGEPTFGPTKTGRTRGVTLSAEAVALLRAHKAAQAALKLRNRPAYKDHGLVFAKEHEDLQMPDARLGQPLVIDGLARRTFQRLAKAAGVKVIKFHGTRHTMATLALQDRTPLHIVSDRLGHANPSVTLAVYAHALPDAQANVAERLGAMLHG